MGGGSKQKAGDALSERAPASRAARILTRVAAFVTSMLPRDFRVALRLWDGLDPGDLDRARKARTHLPARERSVPARESCQLICRSRGSNCWSGRHSREQSSCVSGHMMRKWRMALPEYYVAIVAK